MPDEGSNLERWIATYCDLRSTQPGVAVEARSDLIQPIKELDALYWKRVEEVVSRAIRDSNGPPIFDLEQRALIDLGLLDEQLLGPVHPEMREQLRLEFAEAGVDDQWYTSEWLPEAVRLHVAKVESADPDTQAAPAQLSPDCARLAEVRTRIYRTLTPFLQNMPGTSGMFVESLRAGKLDIAIQALVLLGEGMPPHLADRLSRLTDIRTDILTKARASCTTDRQLAVFDALRQVDDRTLAELKRNASGFRPPTSSEEVELSRESRLKIVLAELKIIRSMVRLGTMGAGITRTHSVLLTDQSRMTKRTVCAILEHVRELDPHLPGSPAFLIAPACGVGSFAWDKDMVILPLIALRGPEDSVVAALASYRIMVDGMQKQGRLRRLYQDAFPDTDFRKDFARDYRTWILGVGKGFRGSMEITRYEFFKKHVGPIPEELFAPTSVAVLSPDERMEVLKHCRAKINRGDGKYQDHYQLAVIYWREARCSESLEQMEIALRLNPSDVRGVFTLGFMYKRLEKGEKAEAAFHDVARLAPNSLWNIYATEQLGIGGQP